MNLEQIKLSVDKMNKNQHIAILKLFKSKSVNLNENKNGCYINLTYLPDDIIHDLVKYITYVDEQEKSLEVIEVQKRDFIKNLDGEHCC